MANTNGWGDVQGNEETTGKRLGGVTGRGFLPGQSGNPGGMAKGLSRLVRESTADGKEIVSTLLACMRDESARWRDRVAAAVELADRGWGKPLQAVEHLGDGQQTRIVLTWGDSAGEVVADERALPPGRA